MKRLLVIMRLSRAKLVALIKALFTQGIYQLSAYAPRSHKAVFGSYKNRFTDNSKYLYLHWRREAFIRCIWISGDKALIKRLQAQGHEAYPRRSLQGIYHCLTAKYYFYSSYLGDINQHLGKGAIKVNLWHGSPMKKIEFDIDSGPLAEIYHAPKPARFNYHQQHIRPDLMLSPSAQMSRCFQSAFRLKPEQLLRASYPRTDYFSRSPNAATPLSQLIGRPFKQVILYAPSWRDTGLKEQANQTSPYDQAFNWAKLSVSLRAKGQVLLLRFHPNEAHLAGRYSHFANIIDISQREDVYDILGQIDLLITDTSSLFIDALYHGLSFRLYDLDSGKQSLHQQQEQSVTAERSLYDYAASLPLLDKTRARHWHLKDFGELLTFLAAGDFSVKAEEMEDYRQLVETYWQADAPSSFGALEQWMRQTSGQTHWVGAQEA